jgi:hypothetical protein
LATSCICILGKLIPPKSWGQQSSAPTKHCPCWFACSAEQMQHTEMPGWL